MSFRSDQHHFVPIPQSRISLLVELSLAQITCRHILCRFYSPSPLLSTQDSTVEMSSPEPEADAMPSESPTDDLPGPGKVICDICLDHIPITSLTTLPCGHSFDPACIRNWTQVTDLADWGESRMWCPVCRAVLLYRCGCIISEHHLRPGVTILAQELSLRCQSYHADTDDHSVSEFSPPFGLRTIAALDDEGETSDEGDVAYSDEAAPENPQEPENLVQDGHDQRDEGEPHDQLPHIPQGHQEPQEPQELQVAQIVQPDSHLIEQAERPKHHNFLFGTNIHEPGEAPESFEKYVVNKKTVVLALETGETEVVDETVWGLKRDADEFEANYPNVNLPLTPGVLKDVREMWKDLKLSHKVFKRQHEGFIELNEVAITFREQSEEKLGERLDTFLGLYS